MNSYIFLCLLSLVCNTVYTSVAYNRLKRNDELILSADQSAGNRMHWKENKGKHPFIVGGMDATLVEIPYVVALLHSSINLFCGGSIINKLTILTAAHCVDGQAASRIMVRAGSVHFGSGGSIHNVARIIVPQDYKPTEVHNDIALLRLSSAIAINNGTIAEVDLPANGSDPEPGAEVKVAGYGRLGDSNDIGFPNHLQMVRIKIISRDECQKMIPSFKITGNMICAGTGGKSACQADSGGPLTHEHGRTEVGVVSRVGNCSAEPAVYTRVGHYVDWIHKHSKL